MAQEKEFYPASKIDELISKFKHKLPGKVKFADVDAFGVVHNIRYFYWLEWARNEYLNHIGIKINSNTFIKEFLVMVVHNEIDFFAPARFYDEFESLTRVQYIKKSSLGFENIIRLQTGEILAKSKAVLVYLNNEMKPERIPDYLREMIIKFEGDDVLIFS
jgi:acyl-CoA thioester hydrolase